LREAGHDVAESRARGEDPGDAVLLDWAAAEGRTLITMDKDFGQLVFLESAKHCGIIRLPDVPAAARIALMERILDEHSREVEDMAIVTVRGGRIRISRSP
jgi:predicted nuclease of predicted toxin-antitoxin system